MDSPFTDTERRFVLSEILKASDIDTTVLVDFVKANRPVRNWMAIQIPNGRNLGQCIKMTEALLDTTMQPPTNLKRKSPGHLVEIAPKRQAIEHQQAQQPQQHQQHAVTGPMTTSTNPIPVPRPIHPRPSPGPNGYLAAPPPRAPPPPASAPKKRGRPSKADQEARRLEKQRASGVNYPPPGGYMAISAAPQPPMTAPTAAPPHSLPPMVAPQHYTTGPSSPRFNIVPGPAPTPSTPTRTPPPKRGRGRPPGSTKNATPTKAARSTINTYVNGNDTTTQPVSTLQETRPSASNSQWQAARIQHNPNQMGSGGGNKTPTFSADGYSLPRSISGSAAEPRQLPSFSDTIQGLPVPPPHSSVSPVSREHPASSPAATAIGTTEGQIPSPGGMSTKDSRSESKGGTSGPGHQGLGQAGVSTATRV